MTHPSTTPVEAHQVVKDYASAFSIQSKLANRTWIVLLTLVIYSLQAQTGTGIQSVKSLPFGFGVILSTHFDIAIYFLISIVTVSFCALFSQTLRIYDAAHLEIGRLENAGAQRRYFDSLSNPTLFRVGPLSVAGASSRNKFVSGVFSLYYLSLRGFSGLVMLGVPAIGLYKTGVEFLQFSKSSPVILWLGWITFAFVLPSLFTVAAKLCDQIANTYRGMRKPTAV